MEIAMGNKSKGQFILSGVVDLSRFLRELKPSTQMAIIATSVEAASKPIVSQARSNVSVRSGALKKSIGAIIRKYPRTGSVAAFIGARRGSYAIATSLKTKKTGLIKLHGSEDSTQRITPANYSHLVEFGHRSVHGGGNLSRGREGPIKGHWNSVNKNKSIRKGTLHETSYIAPKPFLMPAFESGKAFAEQRIIEGFEKAILRECEKAQKKFSKKINLAA